MQDLAEVRQEIRYIAAIEGWQLVEASNMDVFVVDAPDIPQPPIAILYQDGKQYRPTEGGGWRESEVTPYSACFIFDMALARESLTPGQSIIPGVTVR